MRSRRYLAASRQIFSFLVIGIGLSAVPAATDARAQSLSEPQTGTTPEAAAPAGTAEATPSLDTSPATPPVEDQASAPPPQTSPSPAPAGVYMMAPIRSPGDPPAPGETVSLPAAPAPAATQQPPRPKPMPAIAQTPPPNLDARNPWVKQAMTALKRGDVAHARQFANQSGNPVANALVQWRYLLEDGTGLDFDAINAFMTQHPSWPRRDALTARAERAMPADMPYQQVIAWFGNRTPLTGIGMVRLGEALMAAGKRKDGADLIRRAWIQGALAIPDENQLVRNHSDLLDASAQKARLDQLLAHDDIVGARKQMLRVDADTQRLAQARIKLRTSPAAVKTIGVGLPASVSDDPEFLYDQARTFRRRGLDDEAWQTMLRAPTNKDALTVPEHWWNERHIMARDAVREGRYQIAYDLAAKAVTTSNSDTADAQFLAGWIALRFLKQPQIALGHFQALANVVALPISRSRAYYWVGRAEESLSHTVDALEAYRRASQDSSTFYGQLALARVDEKPMLHLGLATAATAASDIAAFESDERVQAIRMLADAGDRDMARLFAIRMANDPPDAKKLQQLAQLMLTLGDQAMSVRVAKLASYNDVILPAFLAPVVSLPKSNASPEPALVLGLTRQESEFDPAVVSSAGARGLMQLMPATAKQAAKMAGLSYRPKDLTTKPQYNMQLGMVQISDFLAQFGGSYILAIASYNAGAGNVRSWVEVNGDPRDPGVDPIDWIESIPFGETRNYVLRVLENVEMYRNRLAGADQRLGIMADLYRPGLPKLAVLKPPPSPVIPAAVQSPLDLSLPLGQPFQPAAGAQ